MKMTTLCYIHRREDDSYLMLHRIKKQNDENAGKWIGVGGKVEQGESPDECVVREVLEETGLRLTHYIFKGVITFISDLYEDEYMMLYEADAYSGEVAENCSEGVLAWVPAGDVLQLPLWEGDRYFLKPLLEGKDRISMKLVYQGDHLTEVVY